MAAVGKLRDKVVDWGAKEVAAKLGAAAAANAGSNLSATTHQQRESVQASRPGADWQIRWNI